MVGFRDRQDAGRQLADRLRRERFERPVVLALPRGGVPVAAAVAAALHAPLTAFVARKVGAPGQPEFGIGAIAEGSDEVLVSSAAGELGIGPDRMRKLATSERAELDRRVTQYRAGKPLPDLESRDVILVDDGLATGVTAEAALRALRRRRPRRLVLAVPVCAASSANRLADVADDVICVLTPERFGAVGSWYQDFAQTTDDEVLALLEQARSDPSGQPPAAGADERSVTVPARDGGVLNADLTVPPAARGVVLFAHGSGSSRSSPRNRAVARALQQRGLATMLTDLLTADEEQVDVRTGHLRFDIGLLAQRLLTVGDWLAHDPATRGLALGYFGASTGAAAALVAAAEPGDRVAAVVSRGGRVDLAGPVLGAVRAPTLLIVGSRDSTVLQLNREALERLRCERRLEVVDGASHLFPEPGTLERVTELAGDWFSGRLG